MEIRMITIGICDDDPDFSKELYEIIHRIMVSVDDWESCIFSSKEEILQAIEEGCFDCQLLFMDIMMEHGMGMEVAKHICSRNLNTDIIFITASREHVFECYHYHAFAYLLKPASEADIEKELQRYLRQLPSARKFLPVSFMGVTQQIPISSILYIESSKRKLIIHTVGKLYYCYQKLADMEEELSENGFIRCHQSFLIAPDKISRISNNQIMIGSTPIPVSSRYRAAVRKQLASFSSTAAAKEYSARTSLNELQKDYGAIIGVRGGYLGAIIRIRPEEWISIGRDGDAADMVVNLPFVSRSHCSLLYHCSTAEYEIVDYSSNGTFVNEKKRLLPDETYLLKPGTELSFGNPDTVFKLG